MSEKYLGENSTPILINQIKENCTQKRSTLPIASIDELGNTYQYTGTSSGSLVHGYFYECVSDGAVTPTYTWQNVNIQPTVTPTASGTTFDNTTSGLSATNVQGAIDEVVGDLGTAASKDFTTNVAPNNHNLVESNAVYSAINNALTSVYTPRGSITCAELLPSLLVEANEGDVYNVTDSGVTTQYFMQGAGVTINAGDSVGIIKTSPNTYLFNLMGNTIDLHEYQKKDLTQAIENATTVEGALNALSTNKATQTEVSEVKQALSDLTATETDNEPYVMRKGLGSLVNFDMVGGTLAWNQLSQNTNWWGINGGSKTYDSTTDTVTYTPPDTSNIRGLYRSSLVPSSHKALLSFEVNPANNCTFLFGEEASGLTADATGGKWNTFAGIINANIGTIIFYAQMSGSGWVSAANILYRHIQVFDLTAMFGTTIADYIYSLEQATAGAGVAFFRKLFPKSYYAYNAGQLLSVKPSGRKVVGFNQWDEQWEVGTYDTSTGEKTSVSTKIRSKNKITVIPNTDYYAKIGSMSSQNIGVFCYTMSGDYLEYITPNLSTGKFTTPTNCCLIAIIASGAYGVVYNNDICINISDPSKNGTYEPYDSTEYTFPSIDLRGLFKLDANNKLYADGDVYNADGEVTRKYGIVDLGTLGWNYIAPDEYYPNGYFLTSIGGKAAGLTNMICSKYVTASSLAGNTDKVCSGLANGIRFYVVDSAYSDVATFTTAMSGVYLVYELATPTTESAPVLVNPQRSFKEGTEEWLDERDVTIPVGHNSTYYQNDTYPAITAYADGVATQLLSYKDNGVLGAKNFALPIKSYATTSQGITTSTDADGITTITGTATSSGGRLNIKSDNFVLKKGTYKIVGIPNDTTKYLDLLLHDSSNNVLAGWGNTQTPSQPDTVTLTTDTVCFVGVNTYNGTAYGTGAFKFGFNVQLASDSDLTYQPYTMTNQQLTDVAQQVEGGYILIASGQTVEVTADGTKTHATLLNELYAAIGAVFSNNPSYYIRALSCRYGSVDYPISLPMEIFNSIFIEYIAKGYYFGGGNGLRTIAISSNSVHQIYDLGNVTFNDISSDVPASGLKYIFKYDVYKKIS